MRKTFLIVLAASIGLGSSTNLAAAGVFSATRPVIAMVDDDIFVGEAEGHINGAGTVSIHSQKDPDLTCVGSFTSTAELGGSGQLNCSNGTIAKFHFQRVSAFRGYGGGTFGRTSISFAYGFKPDEVGPYLKLPVGKKLKHDGIELALVDF